MSSPEQKEINTDKTEPTTKKSQQKWYQYVFEYQKPTKHEVLIYILFFILWIPFMIMSYFMEDVLCIVLFNVFVVVIGIIYFGFMFCKNSKRTMFCIHFFIYGVFVNIYGTKFAFYRAPHQPILPDIVYSLFGIKTEWNLFGQATISLYSLIDILMILDGVIFFIAIIYERMFFTVARRLCLFYGMMSIYRGISLNLTNLPDATDVCRNLTPGTMELKWNMLPFILNHVMNIFIPTTDEYRSSCGDLIFSGHTASLMTLYLGWSTYLAPLHKGYAIANYFYELVNLIDVILIAITHFHYTIDIAVAILVCCYLWTYMHEYIYHMNLNALQILLPSHAFQTNINIEMNSIPETSAPQKETEAVEIPVPQPQKETATSPEAENVPKERYYLNTVNNTPVDYYEKEYMVELITNKFVPVSDSNIYLVKPKTSNRRLLYYPFNHRTWLFKLDRWVYTLFAYVENVYDL